MLCRTCGTRSFHEFIVCKRCGARAELDRTLYRVATVVSYPKSGRTWVSFLLYHYTLRCLGVPDIDYGFTYRPELRKRYQHCVLTGFRGTPYPIVQFTHDSPASAFQTGGVLGWLRQHVRGVATSDEARFLRDRAALLVRDPRDVVVSFYHHQRTKKAIPTTLSLDDFIHDPDLGLARIVRFMNHWATLLGHENLAVVRYERLQADPLGTLRTLLEHLGFSPVNEGHAIQAIEASSFEAMRHREVEKRSQASGGGVIEHNTLRVRRAEAGGSGDEVSPAAADYMNRFIARRLDEAYAAYRTTRT